MGFSSRSYSAASFVLELEGTAVGFLRTVEGGGPYAQVVDEPVDAGGVVKKHIGSVAYQPIVMTFGTGMDKSVYQWIADTLGRKGSAKSGAIIFADYSYKERARLEFDKALVIEIGFPAVDANSKDIGLFTLTLQPQVTRLSAASLGTRINGFTTKTKKKWLASNFRLKISGLETACTKVNAIEAITVKQPVSAGDRTTSGVLAIPNLAFTVAESSAKDILNWADDFLINGKHSDADERAGTLEYLDATLKAVLFTLKFANLGVIRAYQARAEQGAEVIMRIGVELYCEQMSFTPESDALGSSITSTTAPPASDTTSSVTTVIPLTDTLISIIAGRLTPESALKTMVKGADSSAAPPSTTSASEIIAQRLLTTVRPELIGPVVPKWEDGVALGKQWATDSATIDELNEIKTINQDDWSALKLEAGHSLIDKLRGQGMIPDGADGPLQLERDSFVEGIVAGATQVLSNAAPHLTRLSQVE